MIITLLISESSLEDIIMEISKRFSNFLKIYIDKSLATLLMDQALYLLMLTIHMNLVTLEEIYILMKMKTGLQMLPIITVVKWISSQSLNMKQVKIIVCVFLFIAQSSMLSIIYNAQDTVLVFHIVLLMIVLCILTTEANMLVELLVMMMFLPCMKFIVSVKFLQSWKFFGGKGKVDQEPY